MKHRIFLGGTCNETIWRDELIKLIQVDFFNQVVDDWTEDCQSIERHEKEFMCNIHFYLITSDMIGVFSIAEVIDSTYQKGKITIFHVMPDGFGKAQLKSLETVLNMVIKNGGISYIDNDLERSARVINYCFK